MNNELVPEYRKLLEALELRNIVSTRANYAREASCSEIKELTSKNIGILRATFTPEYDIQDDVLGVPVGYKFEVKSDKGVLANFEFQYEVVFFVRNKELALEMLKEEKIKQFFVGYQMEKFVWSYLRSAFAEACYRLGIQSFALPMKM